MWFLSQDYLRKTVNVYRVWLFHVPVDKIYASLFPNVFHTLKTRAISV